jgi:hypothetical protein
MRIGQKNRLSNYHIVLQQVMHLHALLVHKVA